MGWSSYLLICFAVYDSSRGLITGGGGGGSTYVFLFFSASFSMIFVCCCGEETKHVLLLVPCFISRGCNGTSKRRERRGGIIIMCGTSFLRQTREHRRHEFIFASCATAHICFYCFGEILSRTSSVPPQPQALNSPPLPFSILFLRRGSST